MKNLIPNGQGDCSGIYIIRNSVDSRVYVGSATLLYNRFKNHLYRLRKGNHWAIRLQEFCNSAGLDTLSFEVLELCETSELLEREQFFITKHEAASKQSGFNTLFVAGSFKGFKHSPETKEKLSALQSGEKNGFFGRKHTQTAKEAVAAANKQRVWTDEQKAKMSANRKGKPKSEETKAKMKAAWQLRRQAEQQEGRAAA